MTTASSKQADRGFTLIEVMIAAAVSSIVGLAVATMMTNMALTTSSVKATANFVNLQNEIQLIAMSSSQCPSAFKDSSGANVTIMSGSGGLAGLPTSFSGNPASGQAVSQIILNGNTIAATAPSNVAPPNLTMAQIRFSHVIGTITTNGALQSALVNLHFAANRAVGTAGTTAVGGNFMSADVAVGLTINTTGGYTVTSCSLGNQAQLTNPGYVVLPSGAIIEWGQVNMGGGGCVGPTAFPLTFPNAVLDAFVTTYTVTDRISYVDSYTNSGITLCNNGSRVFANWMAIGY